VRDRGPLAAGQLADPRRGVGDWWARRGLGRQALEWLFAKGVLAGWRTPSFERVYDLAERAIPAEVLATPTPTPEDAQRQLLLLAAGSLGVGTGGDRGEYERRGPKPARARVAELEEAGQLVRVTVEGWKDPGYLLPGARLTRPTREHGTLLSPFDSLIWYRARTERLFGFRFRIEVYVPEKDRTHGYFVLPFLLGDDLVARFDLKADRQASTLRVRASHLEPGRDGAEVAPAAAHELHAMRDWLGLDAVAVDVSGTLPFARAVRRAAAGS
jgi:uncharacterized protein YcaQ